VLYVLSEDLAYLKGELFSRHEHKCPYAHSTGMRLEHVYHREQVAQRLARPGFACDHHISALKDEGQCLFLDRSGLHQTELPECGENRADE
jgi:hypothetical protein